MITKTKKILITLTLIITALPLVTAQYTLESVSIVVYSDGYVKVTQILRPKEYTVSASLDFVSQNVEGISVTDENGTPLPYEVNGSSLVVYFENVTLIRVSYYTPDLTTKNGPVWSVHFNFTIPVKITFPDNAIIVDLTDIPLEIHDNSITMPSGNHTISYVIQYRADTNPPITPIMESVSEQDYETKTDSLNSTMSFSSDTPIQTTSVASPQGKSSDSWAGIVFLILLVLVIGGAIFYTKNRKGDSVILALTREDFEKRLKEYELTKDEEKALLYLFDRGGKARQAEIREMLGIPKTTAWRMFQRLEKQGLVKVYKKRRENWVELVF